MQNRHGERGGLVAAYSQGIGLVAVTVIDSGDEARIVARAPGEDEASAAAERVHARWWCDRAADAARVAASAGKIFRRQADVADAGRSSADAAPGRRDDGVTLERAKAAVAAAAKKLHVTLHSEAAIADEATNVAARVDAEMQSLHQCGGLKSVNRAYRNYRLETSARGEPVLRYGEWMRNYRNDLVRQVAATLRLI